MNTLRLALALSILLLLMAGAIGPTGAIGQDGLSSAATAAETGPADSPPLPSSFYGAVKLDNVNVPADTPISAWIDVVKYAEAPAAFVDADSTYRLDVPADDPSTPAREGGRDGEIIVFQVAGYEADQTARWRSGAYTRLDLAARTGPDLVVSDIELRLFEADYQALLIKGTAIATVTNRGNVDVPAGQAFTVTFFEDRDRDGRYRAFFDNYLGEGAYNDGLAVGAAAQVVGRIEGDILFRDNHIHAFVDSGNVVGERDETNNIAHTGARCEYRPPGGEATSAPDLTASHITFDFAGLPAALGVTARIGNGGALQVGPGLPVAFYDGDPATGGALLGRAPTTRTLQPGEYEDVTFAWAAPALGRHDIFVVADDDGTPGGTQNECDETNNVHHERVNTNVIGPDLVIPALDRSAARTDPQALTIAGEIAVRLKNQGNRDVAAPFAVTLFEDTDGDGAFTPGTDNALGQRAYFGSLAVGQSVELQVAVSGTVRFRDDLIYAFADSGREIDELNEDNNLNHTGLQCEYPCQRRIYTSDADFDQGTLLNLNHDDPAHDQLQLNRRTTPFPFIWIALSGRGTVAKVDTVTGEVLGEYKSAPDGRGRNPSRTTVDLNGNVWVANRDESEGGRGSVVHIGLLENWQCVDRNGNGQIDTSTGLDDVKPWPNPGGVDNNGGVSSAADECIIHYTRVAGSGTRTVAVDANNDVWTGGYNDRDHEKISGETGLPIPGTQFNAGCGGYGGLVDGNGVLWSANPDVGRLLRYDPVTKTALCIDMSYSYGLGIDSQGNIWNSRYGINVVSKVSPDGTVIGTFASTGSAPTGLTVTRADDHVWLANRYSANVTRLDKDGNVVATIPVGSYPTGVAEDTAGKVWVTNYGSHNAMRIDPATNAVDLTVPLGANAYPYNYSDMTGIVALGATAPRGTWSVIYDSGLPGAHWGTVRWTSDEPSGSAVAARARAAETPIGLGAAAYVEATNGADFDPADGRYLQIELKLTPGGGQSPTVYDVTVETQLAAPDATASRILVDVADYPAAVHFTVRVGNGGSAPIPAGLPVAFYDGDPAGGGMLLGKSATSRRLAPGEYEDVTFTWRAPRPGLRTIYVVADNVAPDKALSFDGVDDYVTIPDAPALDLNTFTVEAWVYPRQIKSSWQAIFTKHNTSGTRRNYGLFIRPNEMRVNFSAQASDCWTWRGVESNAALRLYQWNHIAGTYDGATMKIYVNGNLDNSANVTDALCQNNEPVRLGYDSAHQPFTGSIDEPRIWNVARTQAEIQAAMSAWLRGDEAGLVGYWRFDEGSGATAHNATSTPGIDGVLVNGPQWVAYTLFKPLDECDETNNAHRQTYITGPVGPDLVVPQVDASGASTHGRTLALQGPAAAQVRNQGTTAVAGDFAVAFFEDLDGDAAYTAGADRLLGRAVHTGGLAPGATVTVTAALSGAVQFVGSPVWAFADSDLTVAELDEANNLNHTGTQCRVAAAPAADLTLSYLRGEPAGSVDLTVRVGNAGQITAPTGIPVTFYLGDPATGGALLGQTATTVPLPAGAFEDVTIRWTGEISGAHAIFVQADAANAVNECNEANNLHQEQLDVLDIPLVAGWNLLSGWVNPHNTDITVVQRPISGTYVVILGFDQAGLSYYPHLPPGINTLTAMDAEHGYWIKVRPTADGGQQTADDTAVGDTASAVSGRPSAVGDTAAILRLVGARFPEDRPLPLDAGWNLVSFLPRRQMGVSEGLRSINGEYTAVLGFEGGALSYYPHLPPEFHTLWALQPLRGYWLRLDQEAELRYPRTQPAASAADLLAIDVAAQQRAALARQAEQTNGVQPTPTWVNFYGPALDAAGRPIPAGALVAAFDPQGVACGAAIVATPGLYGLLACYGDDPLTPADEGAVPGDVLTFTVNGEPAQAVPRAVWTAHGDLAEVRLTIGAAPRAWIYLPLLHK